MSRHSLKMNFDGEFYAERTMVYPEVDAFLTAMCVEDPPWLEHAARVLACPFKVHPACWQQGRIVHAAFKKYLTTLASDVVPLAVDVGTAKGFSALCMMWALAGRRANIVSIDVVDPNDRVRRNTVAEVDGLQTLYETLSPWPEASEIVFLGGMGANWLSESSERVHFCFLDGKHTYRAVSAELRALCRRQGIGDMVVIDDLQIPGVRQALYEADSLYAWKMIEVFPSNENPNRLHAPRRIAWAVRK